MSNAYWNDDAVHYGNGQISLDFYIHTTLDIVGHEVGHAVTFWNSGLASKGYPGAINEGFSDISALAVEDYFERYMTGGFKHSQFYQDKRRDGDPRYQKNRRWWHGWDVWVPYNEAPRYFEVPSWDAKSIDDARDYSPAKALIPTAVR